MEEDARTLSPKGADGAERQAALPIAGALPRFLHLKSQVSLGRLKPRVSVRLSKDKLFLGRVLTGLNFSLLRLLQEPHPPGCLCPCFAGKPVGTS